MPAGPLNTLPHSVLSGPEKYRLAGIVRGNLSSSRLLQQRKPINANSNEWYNLGEYSFEGNLEAGLAVA